MSKNSGIIGVETVEEHEDGGATFKFHMDAHARGLLAEEGLKLVMYCAAAKLDMQIVYDFIEDHIRYNMDDRLWQETEDEYKFGDKDEELDKKFDEYGNYGENNPPVSSEGTWDSQDKTEDLT